MRIAIRVVSFIGLALTAFPSLWMFNGKISFQQYTNYMLIGTILWFSTAPFWVGKENKKKVS